MVLDESLFAVERCEGLKLKGVIKHDDVTIWLEFEGGKVLKLERWYGFLQVDCLTLEDVELGY
jgi:hypothetical protein